MKGNQFMGRPQESCHRCRERRIQCDKKRPGCKACGEKFLDCPGYRPPVSLEFKDESLLAARKVQVRKRKQSTKENATRLRAESEFPANARQKHHAETPFWDSLVSSDLYHFHLPMRDVALSCFVTKCIQGTLLSELHPLYADVLPGSPLSFALYAPALAWLAIDSGQPGLMALAHSQYCQAVRRTKQALSNPKEYLTDDTLASVLHLGLFEVISFDESTVQASWCAHRFGALEMVKLRGIEQLNTHVGRELYVAVLVGIRTICVRRQTKLPQWVMEFESKASKILDAHPIYHIRRILDDFADIQLRQSICTSFNTEIINQCLQLDEAISTIYGYELIAPPVGAVPADTHVILKTRRLNMLRIIRLQLYCWIQEHISPLGPVLQTTSSEIDAQLSRRAYETMKAIATAILESAQQFLTPCVTLNSRFMIFYLYTIVQQPLLPDQLRTRASELIRFIGKEGKIPEALRATERLAIAGLS
ncbi:hypothetical protein V8E51_007249 [Hyaloscypha variabilis]